MKRTRQIKVLLVDDHAIVREGIRSSLVRFPHITVIGEAINGRDAVAKSRKLCPDVVLMDLNMPEMSGLEATPLIRDACPQTKVLALTVHDTKEYVFQLLRTGAHGYVLKDTSPEELVRAVESVSRGEAFFSPKISKIVLQDYVQTSEGPGVRRGRLLSERELEVLRLIAQGNTSKEVAARLGLSARTVETYRVRIKRKLKARNVADLLRHAQERGLL
jgi:two-component system nitrate/nitrite response regulator NarL